MRKLLLKEYKEIDGIKIFHENVDENHDDYNSKGLDNYQNNTKYQYLRTNINNNIS